MERLDVPEELIDLVDRMVVERTDTARDHHIRSVRPVVCRDSRGDPELVGSCVLLAIGEKRFAITAAHVFDEVTTDRALYIWSERKRFTEVRGPRHFSATADRRHDKLDVGFVELSARNVSDLSWCRFLTPEDLSVEERPTYVPPTRSKYLALGYPARKVHLDREAGEFDPTPFVFPSYAVRIEKLYAKLGVVDHAHILIHFERKRVRTIEGQRAYVKPNGVSGGGVWRFPSLASGDVRENKLVGLIIEYHEGPYKVLVTTRITLALEAIRLNYPQLTALIPASSLVRVNARSVPPAQP